MQYDSLPTIEVTLNSTVTPKVVFQDLRDQSVRYRNIIANRDYDTVTFEEFEKGWNALGENLAVDVTDYTQIPYAALVVPSTENGISSCGVRIPACLSESDVLVRSQGRSSKLDLCSTVMPAGTILDCHLNGVGTGKVLVVLFGTNIVFTWPPTPENLKRMERRHGISGPIMLHFLMDELSDMSVTILNKNKGIQLDCGTIYAVMSPNNSAVATWEYVKASWLDSDNVQNGLIWEAELINGRRNNPVAVFESQNEMEGSFASELALWDQLAEKLKSSGEEDLAEKVLQMVGTLQGLEFEQASQRGQRCIP
jgi:hypothetical protein